MKGLSIRATTAYGLLFCIGLLLAAAFFEFGLGLNPCPLCTLQRYIVGLLAVLFFIGLFLKRRTLIRLHNFVIFIIACLGISIAGRQVWLQHLPEDRIPACGPDLDYMLHNMPFFKILKILYHGSGDCAIVQWQFLGLSLPEWSLMAFVLLALLSLINLFRA